MTNSTPFTCGYRRLMNTIVHDAMPFLCLIGPTYYRANNNNINNKQSRRGGGGVEAGMEGEGVGLEWCFHQRREIRK